MAFLENACAFVDHDVNAALDDFLIRDPAALDAGFVSRTLDQRLHFRIGSCLAVFVVEIPSMKPVFCP